MRCEAPYVGELPIYHDVPLPQLSLCIYVMISYLSSPSLKPILHMCTRISSVNFPSSNRLTQDCSRLAYDTQLSGSYSRPCFLRRQYEPPYTIRCGGLGVHAARQRGLSSTYITNHTDYLEPHPSDQKHLAPSSSPICATTLGIFALHILRTSHPTSSNGRLHQLHLCLARC